MKDKRKYKADRIKQEIKYMNGPRCRIVKLKYTDDFDDHNAKKVEAHLDELGRVLDTMHAMGIEARVSYGES